MSTPSTDLVEHIHAAIFSTEPHAKAVGLKALDRLAARHEEMRGLLSRAYQLLDWADHGESQTGHAIKSFLEEGP